MRRRILQECAGLRGRRRRFRRGGIVVSHPVRFKGVSNSSPRQNARVGDHARARVCEQKDRTDLEHGRHKIHSGRKRRDARGLSAKRRDKRRTGTGGGVCVCGNWS